MKRNQIVIPIVCALTILTGCATGPVHDYYNPAVASAAFAGPVMVRLVDNAATDKESYIANGYTLIGTAAWTGKLPESKELIAQAKRVHANLVIYTAHYMPPQPGSWGFSFNQWGGFGGSQGASSSVYVIFLGK
jgi:hypothetical protein